MKVRARAPLRLGFAGGGTDVSPFSDTFGGCVLNATIDMYAHCTIELTQDGHTVFEVKDLAQRWESPAMPSFELEGEFILHKAIYNYVVQNFNDCKPLSVRVSTYLDAPPGSGLGSSSTLVVAILRAYQELLNLPLGEYDLANLAYRIERIDAGLAGGKQDQYAATFGGFNFMEFCSDDRVIVNPLRIRGEIINELESHMLLYFTGLSRESAKIIEDQIQASEALETKALDAMKRVKTSTIEMKEALLKSDIGRMAEILESAWLAKKQTSSLISNAQIERIHEAAINAGAYSAKISGAGGGGFMILFVDPENKVNLANILNKLDGNVYPFHFTKEGAQGWRVN